MLHCWRKPLTAQQRIMVGMTKLAANLTAVSLFLIKVVQHDCQQNGQQQNYHQRESHTCSLMVDIYIIITDLTLAGSLQTWQTRNLWAGIPVDGQPALLQPAPVKKMPRVGFPLRCNVLMSGNGSNQIGRAHV